MPFDPLENLFREKAEEVQHTPPPQFNWTPEKSWDKLQPMLPVKKRRFHSGFYRGIAAGLVLALMTGLFFYRISPDLKSPAAKARMASEESSPIKPIEEKALEEPMAHPVKEQLLPAVAEKKVFRVAGGGKENAARQERIAGKKAMPAHKVIPSAEPGKGPEQAKEQLLAVTEAPAESNQPIKVTVVLGAKTLARSGAIAVVASPAPDSVSKKKSKKDKLRLRIQHMDADFPTDVQLATHKAMSLENGLGTRIKF